MFDERATQSDAALIARVQAGETNCFDEVLRQLSTVQADALRPRFFGGLKFHEIAEAMQCSLTSAKNRVRWGLMRMAELLQTAGAAGAPPRALDQER